MSKIEKFKTLEEGILLLQKEAKSKPISLREVLRVLAGKGRVLLLMLLSLPFCLPIQIPGLSTPFGLVIAFVGLRMIVGKHVWLPKKLLSKKITPRALKKITAKTLFLVKKIKGLIHPRLDWFCHSFMMKILNGLTVFVLGVLLALPLPIPFSNLIVAWPIFLIALGVLEDDGLFVLIGYVVSFVAYAFFIALVILPKYIF
jgi:hypothetical protein